MPYRRRRRPSGGSKWVIEAPYVMAAAHSLKVHLGGVVSSYDLGEALANLVQPFWMLPVLGLFKLNARDVMGYTAVVFLALTQVVIALVLVLGRTLAYPLSRHGASIAPSRPATAASGGSSRAWTRLADRGAAAE